MLVCKGLTIDDVGVSRDAVFEEIWLGADFETGDFVKEKLGGYRRATLANCFSLPGKFLQEFLSPFLT